MCWIYFDCCCVIQQILLPELASFFLPLSIAGVCSLLFAFFYFGPLKWVTVFTTCKHCNLSRIAVLHSASSYVHAHNVRLHVQCTLVENTFSYKLNFMDMLFVLASKPGILHLLRWDLHLNLHLQCPEDIHNWMMCMWLCACVYVCSTRIVNNKLQRMHHILSEWRSVCVCHARECVWECTK